jgi:hypothetical protein
VAATSGPNASRSTSASRYPGARWPWTPALVLVLGRRAGPARRVEGAREVSAQVVQGLRRDFGALRLQEGLDATGGHCRERQRGQVGAEEVLPDGARVGGVGCARLRVGVEPPLEERRQRAATVLRERHLHAEPDPFGPALEL